MARFVRFSALAASVFLISSVIAYAETGSALGGGQAGAGAGQQANGPAQGIGGSTAGADGQGSQAQGGSDDSDIRAKQIQNTERNRDVTRTHKAHKAQGTDE